MASGSLPPSSSKSKSEENPSDAVKSYEFLADTKWWLHPQPKDNTTFWEPSWQTLKIEEYSEVKKLNSIIRDPSQKNPHDDHLLMSENPQKLLSEMESQFNKTEPWWHTVDLDDLAQINKPGERFVPDKGLASLDHVSNFTDSMPRSIGMNESHSPCGVYNLLSSTTPEEAENLQELSKAELLEALCHSQTRAREAEEAAQKAYNEKEHMITHFLKQASHLFAYKQWLHILQLETTCLQLRNSKYRLVYTRSPDTVTWVPTKDAKRVWRKAVKLTPGSPRFKIGAILAALKQPPICFPIIWPPPPPRTPLQASTSKNPVVAVCQLLDTLITEIKMDSIASAVETDVQKTIPSPWEFSCDLEVDYKSEEKAHIVYSALVIDKELQPDKVRRLMSVSDGKLSVHFEATEARFLRASYSAFVDVLTLATKTIEQFGEGMELQLQNL